jgi:hypothetical protein
MDDFAKRKGKTYGTMIVDLLGRPVPRQQRERRQALQWANTQRQSLAALRSGRSRSCRYPCQRLLPRDSVSAPGPAPRGQEGYDRGGAYAGGDDLSLAVQDQDYRELGGNYFDELDRHAVQKRLVRRLERLGYEVKLEPITSAL